MDFRQKNKREMLMIRMVTGLLILLLFSAAYGAMKLNKEIDLERKWRFTIGDNPDFKNPEFNDSDWDMIEVPSPWENEGFPGYNGYAWYRITIKIPKDLRDKKLFLKLGRVDGVDMTYLNGQYIGGRGNFPPNYKTAYNVRRLYPLPENLVKFDSENTIAVRVYDHSDEGGIVRGNMGIYSRVENVNLAVDMSGYWRFKTGDDMKWVDFSFNDSEWDQIMVPDNWENQGYGKHDGIAWYRKSVTISKSLSGRKLILMLGKVNDIEQVYLNGKLLGSSGRFPSKDKDADYKEYYKEKRAYFISPELIRKGAENVFAVRIYDAGRNGGIYEGNIGIATQKEYLEYTKKKRDD